MNKEITVDEALDTLAITCLINAARNPQGGEAFGKFLQNAGVSLPQTVEILKRTERLAVRSRDIQTAVTTLRKESK